MASCEQVDRLMTGPVLLALHTMALYWLACSIRDNPGVPLNVAPCDSR